jgi:cytochrome c oxidase subunit 2
MDHRFKRWRSFAGALLLLTLLVVVVVSAQSDPFPQSTLRPKGDFALMVDKLFRTTLFWATLVFVLVEGALVFVIFKFRGKPDDPEPKQVHGNTMVEVIWTAIPALVLAMIAVPTVRTIFRTYEIPKGDGVLRVEVIGHQWWWEFRYPELGLTTANELHVPVGRTVALKMVTQDVLHSFWIPQLAAKRDIFNNRSTTLWFKAAEAGDYPGQCAEFCGLEHGRMAFQVIAQASDDFDLYVGRMQATGGPVAATAVADTGAQLFMMKGCIGCHSLDATKPMGIGPNLAGIGRRRYIAAGWLEDTDANLAKWIQHPQGVKPGVMMPELGVTEAEALALVAFLRQH